MDNLIFQLTNLGLVLVISLATNLAQVGAFRAAVTLYAPLTLVGRGIVGVAVPELSRRADDPMAVRRRALILAWGLAPIAAGWAIAINSISDDFGRGLLGDSWTMAKPLLLLAGVSTVASLFTVGTVVGLRALGEAKTGLNARIWVSLLIIGCAVVGASLDGAHGAIVALAWSAPIRMATWWWLLVQASRRHVSVATSIGLDHESEVPEHGQG